MKTARFLANPLLTPLDLALVSSFVRNGQLVGIPTETVYGLAADVYQPDAIQKIFTIKGRPADNPLIVHISHLNQLNRLTESPHPLLMRLAEQFWPGPLTLIFFRKPEIDSIVSAGLSTIAVRMPSHPCALQIIDELKTPLAAPSANRSGYPSPTTADHVLSDFDGQISAVVDGGPCLEGIESTVVGFVENQLTLFRPGAIHREAIEDVLHTRLFDPQMKNRPISPGMKYRHYAPRAKVILVEDENDFPKKIENASSYIPKDLNAQNLYSHLRKADQLGYLEVIILLTDSIRSNEALMNRLTRASEV